MGRSKGRQKERTEAIFKVAGDKSLKPRGRPKPVTQNKKLLKMRVHEQVARSDQQMSDLHELVRITKKPSDTAQKKPEVPKKELTEPPAEVPINEIMNTITDLQQSMQID